MAQVGFDEQLYGDELARAWLGIEPKGYDRSDHEVLDAAWAWLEQPRDKPFFAALSTMDFHMPFAVPADAPKSGLQDAPSLAQVLHSSDHAFGQFMARLKASPRAEDTIVVLTADHAVLPHEQLHRVLPPESDYSRTVYDRIPMVIASPLHALPQELDQLANGTDLAPTLLHLLGINGPNALMGRSLLEPMAPRTGLFGSHATLNYVLDARTEPPTEHLFNVEQAVSDEPAVVQLYRRWFGWHQSLVSSERIVSAEVQP